MVLGMGQNQYCQLGGINRHQPNVSQKWHTPKPLASPSKMAQFEYLWGLLQKTKWLLLRFTIPSTSSITMTMIFVVPSPSFFWGFIKFHPIFLLILKDSYVYYYYPYYLCFSTFSLVDSMVTSLSYDPWCLQILGGEGVQHARDALHSHVLETQILRPWVAMGQWWGPQSMLDFLNKKGAQVMRPWRFSYFKLWQLW